MAIYSGFSHWKLWFSMVMLVYQRVIIEAVANSFSDFFGGNPKQHVKSCKFISMEYGRHERQRISSQEGESFLHESKPIKTTWNIHTWSMYFPSCSTVFGSVNSIPNFQNTSYTCPIKWCHPHVGRRPTFGCCCHPSPVWWAANCPSSLWSLC
jgi:hypothetical protein